MTANSAPLPAHQDGDRDTDEGAREITDRLAAIDWSTVASQLDAAGHAVIPGLLTPGRACTLTSLYDSPDLFRSRIVMARHGFGQGEYQYFADPLPEPVRLLRDRLYPPLAEVANRWQERLGRDPRFPPTLGEFRDRCRAAGQTRPTPLLLRYGPGDYNCLHRDLYGDLVFPLQVAALLSRPRQDFRGGHFMLVEQRPRQQSRGHVVDLDQGDAVVFPVHHRPVRGSRGDYRTEMRHGVSTITEGRRETLGIIFHDAA